MCVYCMTWTVSQAGIADQAHVRWMQYGPQREENDSNGNCTLVAYSHMCVLIELCTMIGHICAAIMLHWQDFMLPSAMKTSRARTCACVCTRVCVHVYMRACMHIQFSSVR